MLLKKELQQLAAAIKATSQYAGILMRRRKIFANPRLAGLMQSFEREHSRILHAAAADEELDARLKRLYAERKSFLDLPEVKDYIQATQEYHEMISENMRYLNDLLEISHVR